MSPFAFAFSFALAFTLVGLVVPVSAWLSLGFISFSFSFQWLETWSFLLLPTFLLSFTFTLAFVVLVRLDCPSAEAAAEIAL